MRGITAMAPAARRLMRNLQYRHLVSRRKKRKPSLSALPLFSSVDSSSAGKEGGSESMLLPRKKKKKRKQALGASNREPVTTADPRSDEDDAVPLHRKKKRKSPDAARRDSVSSVASLASVHATSATSTAESSQKAKKVNKNLQGTKLHTLTGAKSVLPSHLKETVHVGLKTGAKNTNIWCENGGFQLALSPRRQPNLSVSVEAFRNRCVARCREMLGQLVQPDPAPPVMSWERWQANSKLAEEEAGWGTRPKMGGQHREPLLPADAKLADAKGLVSDLLRCASVGGDRAKAQAVVEKLNAFAESLSKEIGKKSEGAKKAAEEAVSVVEHKHSCDVFRRVEPKRLLKVNRQHFEKLKRMHELTAALCEECGEPAPTAEQPDAQAAGSEGSGSKKKKKKKKNKDDADTKTSVNSSNGNNDSNKSSTNSSSGTSVFERDLYLMLSRYNSLLGHGMQCALPENVFTVLDKRLGASFECFASPLNARYPVFCSAFLDTDAKFGSLGSFFEATAKVEGKKGLLRPGDRGYLREHMLREGGGYEVNPPFIEGIMHASVQRVYDIMAEAEAATHNAPALTFVFILPGWLESGAYRQLAASARGSGDAPMCVQQFLIAASDHGYVSGAQHQRKDRFFEVPYDTAVFVLQNRAARALFPIGSAGAKPTKKSDAPASAKSFEEELRHAFASGIPTEAMKQRRLKEGRGFGDKDGGGGVYKGKKKKKQRTA
mmetsp:Transcript_61763/g.145575  ORF Transcript_61763/g.145575 Transcript_61763/m.145575 type:complete len:720 (+) Transcript_61763:199-2358(+)